MVVGGVEVAAGTREQIHLPVARYLTGEWMNLPVEVIHGSRPGPAIWMSGAIHGDELDGVEITRGVSESLSPARLSGTVFAIPIVNVFGFLHGSRYLPDRRDLNRAFPGTEDGSMAARLAWLFTTEIVDRCEWGLDFHCGSGDRENLPQVRGDLEDEATRAVAEAFAPPLMIHNQGPEGSLRRSAIERGARTLVFEGGEAGRFTQRSIEVGVSGALRVLRHLEMIGDAPAATETPLRAASTHWVRASRSGIVRLQVELGEPVKKGKRIGEITEILGSGRKRIRASNSGIVIGRRVTPLIYKGEALVHIARSEEGG